MGNAFVSTTAHRIEVDGDWVDIKPKLGLKDRGRFSSAVYLAGQNAKSADGMRLEINLGAIAGIMLKLAVVAWSFDAPIDEEHIDQIDMDDPLWDAVLEAVQEKNPTLMELAAVSG